MMSIDNLLEIYGNGITADDFADQLGDVMRRRVASDPRAVHDRTVLTAVGVPAVNLIRQPSQGLVDHAARLLEENSRGLTAAAAAERLGRSAIRIRGAIADGSLYGVKVGRSWLVPLWQLDQAGPLPHLRKVIAAIPEGTLIGRTRKWCGSMGWSVRKPSNGIGSDMSGQPHPVPPTPPAAGHAPRLRRHVRRG